MRPLYVGVIETFILVFVIHSLNCVEQNRNSGYVSSNDITKLILDWWNKNSVPKPYSCKYRIRDPYSKTFLNKLKAPSFKIYSCSSRKESNYYYFKGESVKNGLINGKGKLTLINKDDWTRFPNERKKDIISQDICVKASNIQSKNVVEVIGNFKNGFLHGMIKMIYHDKSFSIASYSHGKVHGYQRLFNQEGKLIETGVYDHGWQTGYHIKMESDHLIIYDTTMITDDIKLSMLFPIANNDILDTPIIGYYYPNSGAVENISAVEIESIGSNSEACQLELNYIILERLHFTYSLYSKKKFPIFDKKQDYLCNIVSNHKERNPSSNLKEWFSSIDNILKPEEKYKGTVDEVIKSNEIIWRLKPIEKPPAPEISTRLISDVKLDLKSQIINARIFGSPMIKMTARAGAFKLDGNMKLNGFNDLWVLKEFQSLIPPDVTLGWVPIRIMGMFDHGTLNGMSYIETNASTKVSAMVKDGILHGPFVSYGISFILETVSMASFQKNS